MAVYHRTTEEGGRWEKLEVFAPDIDEQIKSWSGHKETHNTLICRDEKTGESKEFYFHSLRMPSGRIFDSYLGGWRDERNPSTYTVKDEDGSEIVVLKGTYRLFGV